MEAKTDKERNRNQDKGMEKDKIVMVTRTEKARKQEREGE